MGTLPRAIIVLCGAVASSCAGGERPDPPPEVTDPRGCPSDLPDDTACGSTAPSYAEQTAAIIEQRCTACHFSENTQSTYVFESHADVFEQRRSMLTQIYSCRMPPEGAAPLSAVERSELLQWFVCGAPDN